MKHLKKFLVLFLIVPIALILTACGSGSAYDLAVKNGYEGSEEDWLNSLKGKSAYELALDNGFVGTEKDWLDSLKGIDGTNGKDGKDAENVNTYEAWQAACNDPDNPYQGTYIEFLKEIVGEQNYDSTATVINKCVQSVLNLFVSNLGGSAVLYKYNSDGTSYLVTNNHMTVGKLGIYTLLSYDQTTTFNATFVGGALDYDIAVLKVGAAGTSYLKSCGATAVTLADHFLGEECFSVGNTEGHGISVTAGRVSVESEDDVTYDNYHNVSVRVFRHDTYISNGNSGGAIFDTTGNMLGITNGGVANTEMNYAIPSSIVQGVADNIIENSERGLNAGLSFKTIGLEVGAAARDTKTHYDDDLGRVIIEEKVCISSITENSLAERYNSQNTGSENIFKVGDKLVSVTISQRNKTYNITRTFNLSEALLNARIGDELVFKLDRGGSEIEVRVLLSATDATNFRN